MRTIGACFGCGFAILMLGCGRGAETGPPNRETPTVTSSSATPLPTTPAPPTTATATASIGVARMLPDRTLELDLHGPGGAEARIVYPPSHARYKETLEHLGGLTPGEEKPVPPWSDP